jgi:hypothetical protein
VRKVIILRSIDFQPCTPIKPIATRTKFIIAINNIIFNGCIPKIEFPILLPEKAVKQIKEIHTNEVTSDQRLILLHTEFTSKLYFLSRTLAYCCFLSAKMISKFRLIN